MRELTAISRPSIKRTHVAAGATPLLHKTRRVLHEWSGARPRSNVSMTIMRPPQHGHGYEVARFGFIAVIGRSFCCVGSPQRATRAPARWSRLGAAGEQAVVPDAVEAAWQDVDEEAADELVGLERHGLVAAGPSIR